MTNFVGEIVHPLFDWTTSVAGVHAHPNEGCCGTVVTNHPACESAVLGSLASLLFACVNLALFALLPVWLLLAVISTVIELCTADAPNLKEVWKSPLGALVGPFFFFAGLYMIVQIISAHARSKEEPRELLEEAFLAQAIETVLASLVDVRRIDFVQKIGTFEITLKMADGSQQSAGTLTIHTQGRLKSTDELTQDLTQLIQNRNKKPA